MTDLEKRKKLLVAESEAFRELLRFQVRNLHTASRRAKQRFVSFKAYLPLAAMTLPILRSLFGRRRRSGFMNLMNVKRFGTFGIVAWQLLQRFGPMLSKQLLKKKPNPGQTEAEEYLSKRI